MSREDRGTDIRPGNFGIHHQEGAGMIVLDSVSLRRGSRLVLRDISLEIQSRCVTAVVGRSGVGKTTLLHALNGLVRPSSGRISVRGVGTIDSARTLRAHRRRTATVFQDHALIDRLPAIDNVLLGLADLRHPLAVWPWPGAMVRDAAEALEDVGLLARAGARTSCLSGGERQRVGLARALVRRPALLLGDEPFAAVDPGLVGQLAARLRRAVHETDMTAVIVLHQLETALTLADRIIGLGEGGVVFDGPAADFDKAAQDRLFQAPARGLQ